MTTLRRAVQTGAFLLLIITLLTVVPTATAAAPTIKTVAPASGTPDGGTTVTITGTKFSGQTPVTSVTFDGLPASFSIESPTQIKATTPAHPEGQVSIVVTNADGTATTGFTYAVPAPTPTPEPTPSSARVPERTPEPAPTSSPSTSPSSTPDATPTPTTSAASAPPTTVTVYTTTSIGSGQAPAANTPPAPTTSASPSEENAGGSLATQLTSDLECSATISPSAPGERLVVPFPSECGVSSVVVRLPVAAGPLTLTVRNLIAWPNGVPPPEMATAPVLAFDAELRDENGTRVEPETALLQVRVPGKWIEECGTKECRAELFHYHEGAWSRYQLQTVDETNGTAVLEATTNGFSVFAVGVAVPEPGFNIASLAWLLLPIMGVAVAGTTVVVRRQRAPTPEDEAQAERLVKEMQDKQELLQFVNNAAHDLANPLTPIQMQLELLSMAAEKNPDEKQKKSLAVVRRNVQQLGFLITDLRDASKLQAGKLRMSFEPIDVTQLAQEVAESYHEQAAAAKIQLIVHAPLPLETHADSGRLTQVLTNFLNNALKFTPEGGKITVAAVQEAKNAVVHVRDTGLGLTDADRARLFRPFSQVHGEKEKKKGTGLGLYIAKGIVEAHRGEIGCKSDGPGTGSTFWFSVPLIGPEEVPKDAQDATVREKL